MPFVNDIPTATTGVTQHQFPAKKKFTTGRLWVRLGLGLLLMWVIAAALFKHNPSPNELRSDAGSTAAFTNPISVSKVLAADRKSPIDFALSALKQELDPERRAQLLMQIVEALPGTELPHALELLEGAQDNDALELQQGLVRRWAESEPSQAALWVSALEDNASRGPALVQVATAWANIDPDAAANWLQTLPQAEEATSGAVLAFTYEAARSRPLTALAAAGRLAPGPERDAALAHSISQWAGSDPNQAYAWAATIPDPELRQQLLAVVLTAAGDYGSIAAGLAAQLNPGDQQNRVAVSIVQRWAQTSPETAAAWVAQFPDGPLRSAAVENLVAIWSATDPDGARAWLGQLAPALRDEVMKDAAPVSGGSSPAVH